MIIIIVLHIFKAKLRKKGNDIIDFGMGNPDMPTPKHIRDKLKEVVDKPGVGRYSVSKGINGLRLAQSKYYKKRFNVDKFLCFISLSMPTSTDDFAGHGSIVPLTDIEFSIPPLHRCRMLFEIGRK